MSELESRLRSAWSTNALVGGGVPAAAVDTALMRYSDLDYAVKLRLLMSIAQLPPEAASTDLGRSCKRIAAVAQSDEEKDAWVRAFAAHAEERLSGRTGALASSVQDTAKRAAEDILGQIDERLEAADGAGGLNPVEAADLGAFPLTDLLHSDAAAFRALDRRDGGPPKGEALRVVPHRDFHFEADTRLHVAEAVAVTRAAPTRVVAAYSKAKIRGPMLTSKREQQVRQGRVSIAQKPSSGFNSSAHTSSRGERKRARDLDEVDMAAIASDRQRKRPAKKPEAAAAPAPEPARPPSPAAPPEPARPPSPAAPPEPARPPSPAAPPEPARPPSPAAPPPGPEPGSTAMPRPSAGATAPEATFDMAAIRKEQNLLTEEDDARLARWAACMAAGEVAEGSGEVRIKYREELGAGEKKSFYIHLNYDEQKWRRTMKRKTLKA